MIEQRYSLTKADLCKYECAHGDCYEFRGRDSKCYFCKKPVPYDKIFRFPLKKGLYASHKACYESRKVSGDEDPDT